MMDNQASVLAMFGPQSRSLSLSGLGCLQGPAHRQCMCRCPLRGL